MTIQQISASTVKIRLSAGELAAYQVTFSMLGNASPETLAMLAVLISRAEAESTVSLRDSRIFVEAFACEDGSCLLYLSAVPKSAAERSGSRQAADVVLCEFTEAAVLCDCCRRCLHAPVRIRRSACYQQNGVYRLVLRIRQEDRAQAERILGEYGHVLPATSLLLSLTLEHFACLCTGSAVPALALCGIRCPAPALPPPRDLPHRRDSCR